MMADFSVLNFCVKYMLFIFNLAFVITGIIIISVGAVAKAEYDNYSYFLDQPYRSIPAFLIAIGVLIFIVTFFGCYGVIDENYSMSSTVAHLPTYQLRNEGRYGLEAGQLSLSFDHFRYGYDQAARTVKERANESNEFGVYVVTNQGRLAEPRAAGCRQKRFAVFLVLLIGIFILEVAAGISGYVLRDRTSSVIQKSMVDSIPIYLKNAGVSAIWNEVQQNFECCGVYDFKDWKTQVPSFEEGLPLSCCSPQPGVISSIYCTISSENLYKNGCSYALSEFLRKQASSIGATGVCIAIFQFLGIIFACHLAKRTKYEMSIYKRGLD